MIHLKLQMKHEYKKIKEKRILHIPSINTLIIHVRRGTVLSRGRRSFKRYCEKPMFHIDNTSTEHKANKSRLKIVSSDRRTPIFITPAANKTTRKNNKREKLNVHIYFYLFLRLVLPRPSHTNNPRKPIFYVRCAFVFMSFWNPVRTRLGNNLIPYRTHSHVHILCTCGAIEVLFKKSNKLLQT